MKKFLLALLLIFSFQIAAYAQADYFEVYPLYGYNQSDHICQIKQMSQDSDRNENLIGEYWSLRECRSENPQIIFFTGSGILIWLLLFIIIIIANFVFSPLTNRKLTTTDKKVNMLFDLGIIATIMFFIILLQHYFDVPQAFYNYQSDIDYIVYCDLIKKQLPSLILFGYIIIKILIIFAKRKK